MGYRETGTVIDALTNDIRYSHIQSGYDEAISKLQSGVGVDVSALIFDKVVQSVLEQHFFNRDWDNITPYGIKYIASRLDCSTKCINELAELRLIMNAAPPLDSQHPDIQGKLDQALAEKSSNTVNTSNSVAFFQKQAIAPNVNINRLFKESGEELFTQLIELTKSSLTGFWHPANNGINNLAEIIKHVKLFQQKPNSENLVILIQDAQEFHEKILAESPISNNPSAADYINKRISESYTKYVAAGLIILGLISGGLLGIFTFPIAYNLLYPTQGMRTKAAIEDLLEKGRSLLSEPSEINLSAGTS